MKKKEFKILSIDGGGIRGLIPALFLANIEGRLQKPLYSYFDLICGTSTGGFIALAAAKGVKMKELTALYEKKAPLIFPKSYPQKAKNLFRDMALYDNKALIKELSNIFGNGKMSDLKTNAAVTGSNVTSKTIKIFKKPKACSSAKNKNVSDENFYIKDVALATSAAPYYLKQKKIKNEIFWDGGLWANNPAICALTEAKRMNSRRLPLKILSLGTGSIQNPDVKIVKPGLASPDFFVTYMMDIQALAVAYQMELLIDAQRDIYKRIDCSFDKSLPMDDINIIEKIKSAAHLMTHKHIEETVKTFF